MNRLIVYGCSFTAGDGCLPTDQYGKEYKLTEEDKIWPEIVSEKLGLTLVNYGVESYSNDKILDRIINTYNTIGENDIVIIESTFTHRFDIPNKKQDKLLTVIPNPDKFINREYFKDEIEKISFVCTLMDCELYHQRHTERFNFIKQLLISDKKVRKCVLWDLNLVAHNFEMIWQSTSNKILNYHWSYKGHKDFSEHILLQIEKNDKQKSLM